MSATKSKFAVALFLGFVIGMPAADARITRIVVDRVEAPTFGGASFGNVGQYEKLVGRAYGELARRNGSQEVLCGVKHEHHWRQAHHAGAAFQGVEGTENPVDPLLVEAVSRNGGEIFIRRVNELARF